MTGEQPFRGKLGRGDDLLGAGTIARHAKLLSSARSQDLRSWGLDFSQGKRRAPQPHGQAWPGCTHLFSTRRIAQWAARSPSSTRQRPAARYSVREGVCLRSLGGRSQQRGPPHINPHARTTQAAGPRRFLLTSSRLPVSRPASVGLWSRRRSARPWHSPSPLQCPRLSGLPEPQVSFGPVAMMVESTGRASQGPGMRRRSSLPSGARVSTPVDTSARKFLSTQTRQELPWMLESSSRMQPTSLQPGKKRETSRVTPHRLYPG